MHWVIQRNFNREAGVVGLVEVLTKLNLPHSFHKVVPLRSGNPAEKCEIRDDEGNWAEAVGGIWPTVTAVNPIIAIGTYSLRHLAKANGWQPGIFDIEAYSFLVQRKYWYAHLLNYDATLWHFSDVPLCLSDFFMRPLTDSKVFAGKIFSWAEYWDWRHRVIELGENDGTSLRSYTWVMVASPKKILREYRCWVIDQRIVTASLYKLGNTVTYSPDVEPAVLAFATARAQEWSPVRAYVMDVALVSTEPQFKIIEINTLNSAGLYAANVPLLVDALESMGY